MPGMKSIMWMISRRSNGAICAKVPWVPCAAGMFAFLRNSICSGATEPTELSHRSRRSVGSMRGRHVCLPQELNLFGSNGNHVVFQPAANAQIEFAHLDAETLR